MASVTWQGFSVFVQNAVAAVQAAATAVIDASVGSVTLALAQAQSATALFLQGQAAQVTALTRLGTSFGSDVDSFINQFGMTRLPATYATTTATFSRFTATQSAFIPAGAGAGANITGGAVISTGPGGAQFMVAIDTTNPLWSGSQGGYVLPAPTASVTVPIQSLSAGVGGNVLANTITSFFAPIPGLDTVTNPAAATNGVAQESDPAVKGRFPLWLAGLARANFASIASAIEGVQQGIQYEIIDNRVPMGSDLSFLDAYTFFDSPGTLSYPTFVPWPGRFFVIVDDGTGSPSQSLINAVRSAIDPVRGFTIEWNVVAPIKLAPTISLTMSLLPGFDRPTAVGAAQTAINNFLASSTLGVPLLSRTRTAAAVYAAVPGIANILDESILINGVAADLTLNPMQVYKPGGAILVN